MNNQFENMQKLAFGKVLINESKMTKKELKDKIREMILDEAKKKKKDEEEPTDVAPQEDVTTSTEEAPMDTITPTAPDATDIDPTVKNVQDLLQKAFVSAKQLGDEKLMNQIGNTLTMLVRTQVLGAQQSVAENVNEMLSSDFIDRIEGLANVQDLSVLKAKLRILTSDWTQEGFDKEDVKEYINSLIDQI